MFQQESEETLFTFIMTRLKSFKKIVFYDNACNLYQYMASREGSVSLSMQFVVDHFHSVGHVNCPSSLRQPHNDLLRGINASVCEQSNAMLQSVKTQIAFMLQHNFTGYLRFYIASLNERRLKQMLDLVNKDDLAARNHLQLARQMDDVHNHFFGTSFAPRISHACSLCEASRRTVCSEGGLTFGD
jgi:hypothetical protein